MAGGRVLGQGLPRQCLLPLLPSQLVCTRAVRQWIHPNVSDPPKVVLGIDFENACKCIDRRTSLQQCRLGPK